MAVLDASFLIDLERDLPSALTAFEHLLDNGHSFLMPAQAALEYLTGYDDPGLNLEDLERSFQLIPFGRRHLLQSARLGRISLSGGRFPGWGDVKIASTAALEGDFVVTGNPKHFTDLGCPVWDYRNDPAPPDGD